MKYLIKSFLVCLSTLMLAGCLQTYQRNLGDNVHSVHFEFFDNQTYEANLSSQLCDALVEEMTANGSLVVKNRDEADIVVDGVITGMRERLVAVDGDNVPTVTALDIYADVEIYKRGEIVPFQVLKKVTATGTFNPDMRRTLYSSREDGKSLSTRLLAQKILERILFVEIKDDKDDEILQDDSIISGIKQGLED